jgi:hypothetical protein
MAAIYSKALMQARDHRMLHMALALILNNFQSMVG